MEIIAYVLANLRIVVSILEKGSIEKEEDKQEKPSEKANIS